MREITNSKEKQRLTRQILGDLPEWFGIPASTEEYIEKAANAVFFLEATEQGKGFVSLRQTAPTVWEIDVMGVEKRAHHQGIGRKLVQMAIRYCQEEGADLLQVKTLAAQHPDPYYRKTRQFYQAVGFIPVEVFKDLWGPANPCLQMILIISSER